MLHSSSDLQSVHNDRARALPHRGVKDVWIISGHGCICQGVTVIVPVIAAP
ncbi:MAG: hypothetical protein HY070_08330 [Chloroflexi bacterium]|nr:hypothetical protein [Chloroflexota bacterium]